VLLFALMVCSIGSKATADEKLAGKCSRPASIDLRPEFQRWDLSPRRQGGRGTCSVFAVTGALEYSIAIRQRCGVRLSVEFLNWAAHKAVNRTEDGGFFFELWQGYKAHGICAETNLPYQTHFDPTLEPSATVLREANTRRDLGLTIHWIKEWDVLTGLTDEQLERIKETLRLKWPVCGGLRWPKQPSWQDGVLQWCPPDSVFDGHSVLLIGYQDDTHQPGGGAFLIRNSGGDGSDGWLSYAYVRDYMNDALWIGINSGDHLK
jgi:C1A family cysteine protease